MRKVIKINILLFKNYRITILRDGLTRVEKNKRLKFVDNSLQFINGSLSFNNHFSYNEKYKTVSFWILINEENEEQTVYYEGFEREKQVIIIALRGKTLVIKSEPVEYDIDFSSYLRKMDSCLFISRRA